MKIDIFVLCKNEIKLAPFMIDYWNALADDINVFVYDGLSTDGTRELFAKYDYIHVIDFEPDALDDKQHQILKNNCWKNSKADFVMVCDFDETIMSYDVKTLREKLQDMKDNGYSILLPMSFDIVADRFPEYQEGKFLHELAEYGYNNYEWEAKAILFDPSKITEINYIPGGHFIRPQGEVNYCISDDMFLIHCKHIGFSYYKERIDNRILSEWNIKNHLLGEKQLDNNNYIHLIKKFNELMKKRFKFTDIKDNIDKYYAVYLDWSRWLGMTIYRNKFGQTYIARPFRNIEINI